MLPKSHKGGCDRGHPDLLRSEPAPWQAGTLSAGLADRAGPCETAQANANLADRDGAFVGTVGVQEAGRHDPTIGNRGNGREFRTPGVGKSTRSST